MGTSVFGNNERIVNSPIGLTRRTIVKAKKESIEDELLLLMLTYQSSTDEEEEKKEKEQDSIRSRRDTNACLFSPSSRKNTNIRLTHSSWM